MDYGQIAKLTKLTAEAVRKRGRRMGLPPKVVNSTNRQLTPAQEIERDVKVGSLDKRLKKTDAKYQLMVDKAATLEAQLEALKVVGNENSYHIPKANKKDTSEATAVAVASDWHWEETVHSDNVNGMNEFNTSIATARANKFFQNVVRLCNIFGKESHIKTLILALLGDFINGQLREEAMENNSMRPMDAVIEVWKVIAGGIKYILDNTDLDIVVPCHSGNHARVTKKIHASTEAGNSLEYVLYHGLASEFKGNPRVKFIIPTSYHSYVDVAGFTIRFHHGHAIKYGGGIGGIFIPSFKAISQWNKGRNVNLDVFGHFHASKDGGNFLCNGSLIGWNEYANFIKADYEQPKQTFFLVDHSRREKTVTTPVFLT